MGVYLSMSSLLGRNKDEKTFWGRKDQKWCKPRRPIWGRRYFVHANNTLLIYDFHQQQHMLVAFEKLSYKAVLCFKNNLPKEFTKPMEIKILKYLLRQLLKILLSKEISCYHTIKIFYIIEIILNYILYWSCIYTILVKKISTLDYY